MNIEVLREFVVFADYLNFSSAAKAMHMSQPALSNHMAELEKETGIELINRDHPVSLTSAGKVFCEDSSKIVRSYDTMLERCRSLIRHAPSGRLIVKTPVVLGYDNGLTAIVRQYEKENPGADIRFSNGDGQTLLELIRCGAMDCGVFYGFSPAGLKRDDGAPIRFVTVATIPIAAIMRPDNRLASKEKLQYRDFDGVRYPMPAGAMYDEFRRSAEDMIVRYGLKPNTYMRPVNSFQEFPHSIDDEEVFLFSPLPDSDGTHLISREFDPPIRQTLVVALCVDERKPVSVHFYNYLKHFELEI